MDHLARVKSLIVTTAAEFRTLTVQSLNAVGFTADKQTLDSVVAITPALEDPHFGNVVIDTGSVKIGDLKTFCSDLAQAAWTSTANFLVYLPEERMGEVVKLGNEFPRFLFRALPFKRQDVIDALVTPRAAAAKAAKPVTVSKNAGVKGTPAPAKPVAAAAPAVPKTTTGTASTTNATIVEAIEHVRATVDKLKLLATGQQNAATLAMVQDIGQRFNGIYGTFLFFANRDGYPQLARLSEIIDAVAKTEASSSGSVPKTHVELMLMAARCALGILKELRANQPLTETQRQEFAKVDARYIAMGDVFHRSSTSQDEVDTLLDKAKRGA